MNDLLYVYPVFKEFDLLLRSYDLRNECLNNMFNISIKRGIYSIQELVSRYPIFTHIGKYSYYVYDPISAMFTYHKNIVELLMFLRNNKEV